MQILKFEKKKLAPPLPNPGDAPELWYLIPFIDSRNNNFSLLDHSADWVIITLKLVSTQYHKSMYYSISFMAELHFWELKETLESFVFSEYCTITG